MRKKVLLLGDSADNEIKEISECLQRRHIEAVLLNTADFPSHFQLAFDPSTNSCLLFLEKNTHRLEDFLAFFWRRFIAPDKEAGSLSELTSALSPLFYHRKYRWFNSIDSIRFHQSKPIQLAMAAKLGAKIPATIIGNRHKLIIKLNRRHQRLIEKPVFGGSLTHFYSPIDRSNDNDNLHFPKTIQEWIPGDNIRTYVIGENTFSGRIMSTSVDYRAQTHVNADAISLPKNIHQLSLHICKAFGMKWCAIDWRKNGDNYVFLEANPCPYFLRFEHETGHPITACLVNALLR